MEQPKFKVGDKVKVKDDVRMSGEILTFQYSPDTGYSYKVTSRYYDASINDMVEGVMTCKEEEIEKIGD